MTIGLSNPLINRHSDCQPTISTLSTLKKYVITVHNGLRVRHHETKSLITIRSTQLKIEQHCNW